MNFKKLLSGIEKLFRQTEIPYMLVGGFAVAYWGYPRQSLDIDIVIGLTQKSLAAFLRRAQKLGFMVHHKEVETVLKMGNRFVMELDDFTVDCWLPKSRFEKTALKNRKRRKLFGQTISVIGPENLVLSKLLVARPRDLEDVKTILMRQTKKLNAAYLRKEAFVLGVNGLLDQIMK